MPLPLVTIITPSFNQANFIANTIDSVLSQNYPNIEYWIIDGNSSDNTLDILRKIQDIRLHWISESDTGQSNAINKGIERSTGTLLTYLNSDDLLLPDAISQIVEYFDSHFSTKVVYGDVVLIDSAGKSTGTLRSRLFDLRAAVMGRQYIMQPGTFWRRSVTESIGLFDESLHYVMDQDYWLRAALAGHQLDYVPGCHAAFRIHRDSKTVSQSPQFFQDWYIIAAKIFSQNDLPDTIKQLESETYRSIDWQKLKTLWAEKRRDEVQPQLKLYFKDHKLLRRILARSMAIDYAWHTPFTQLIAILFYFLKGEMLLK